MNLTLTKLNEEGVRIDISQLSSGVYLIIVNKGEYQQCEKLIICK
jgi:hypothetical protein